VAFALEPGANPERAFAKITAKKCDLIVVNDVTALEADKNAVAVYDSGHEHVGSKQGTKRAVAGWLVRIVERRLVGPGSGNSV
jgi:phosphopantothenoylcysteine synthetase/decarboxylase